MCDRVITRLNTALSLTIPYVGNTVDTASQKRSEDVFFDVLLFLVDLHRVLKLDLSLSKRSLFTSKVQNLFSSPFIVSLKFVGDAGNISPHCLAFYISLDSFKIVGVYFELFGWRLTRVALVVSLQPVKFLPHVLFMIYLLLNLNSVWTKFC